MTNTKRTIAIDEEYRLAFPDLSNITIERLVIIDPTKSPTFDPEKHSKEIRTEWRSINKYYSTIPKALSGLLEYKIRTGDATTLREVLYDIKDFRRHIDGLLGSEV